VRATLLILLALISLTGLIGLAMVWGDDGWARGAPAVAPPLSYWPDRVAANGVVEGARPEAALRPEVPGILMTVLVRENHDVAKGTLLAELRNETQVEEVALARAELDVARAQLLRLRNGERAEKRKAMAAIEEAKRAAFQQTKADWDRTHRLAENRATSREQGDRDYYGMLKAKAEYEEAAAEHALVEVPARADEVYAARARVAVAETRLRLAKAELAKTRLLAPTDGRVLRVQAEPGEASGPNTPQPVLLMADLSRRRVRAFIEELDSARVKVGQRAIVTADGLPGTEFTGCVGVTLPRMGQRALQTDAASEYRDVYFREVLIDLDAGDELPLNLRVKTLILVGPARGSR
jgi:multidrug resistance efflux pump